MFQKCQLAKLTSETSSVVQCTIWTAGLGIITHLISVQLFSLVAFNLQHRGVYWWNHKVQHYHTKKYQHWAQAFKPSLTCWAHTTSSTYPWELPAQSNFPHSLSPSVSLGQEFFVSSLFTAQNNTHQTKPCLGCTFVHEPSKVLLFPKLNIWALWPIFSHHFVRQVTRGTKPGVSCTSHPLPAFSPWNHLQACCLASAKFGK